MKRTGFKRPEYVPPPPAPIRPATRRAQMVASTFVGSVPKEPADRLDALLRLAEGEECTVRRYGGFCRCRTDQTVWAHTNTQADQKGMGYKGHDSAGFFAGYHCHTYIDQPPASEAQREEIAALVAVAQERTRVRLMEIAASRTERPWKVEAARRALEMIEAREVSA